MSLPEQQCSNQRRSPMELQRHANLKPACQWFNSAPCTIPCKSLTKDSISLSKHITSDSCLRIRAISPLGSACFGPNLALGFLRSRL